jgi:MFS family permease
MGLSSTFSKAMPVVQSEHRSADEKALVRRLDMFLLTFGCISQVIKYLDQQNINNAYVSGMKEDLNLYGNELNYFSTYFNIAYCLMLIPSQAIMTYVRPSYWLTGLEVTWGVITGLMALAKNAKQIYVLRVFLGLCESSAWPGMMTLLMHWYTPMELAKRMGFYQSCQTLGYMMSGALQAAIIATLEGKGLAGWRWLFVISESNSLSTSIMYIKSLTRFSRLHHDCRLGYSRLLHATRSPQQSQPKSLLVQKGRRRTRHGTTRQTRQSRAKEIVLGGY